MSLVSQIELCASFPDRATHTAPGFVNGGVRVLLRLEGFAAFAGALALYAHGGLSWPVFALFSWRPIFRCSLT
jgi:hypothetical protein